MNQRLNNNHVVADNFCAIFVNNKYIRIKLKVHICLRTEMSKIPAPTKMDPRKSIFSKNQAPSRKNKSHVCPRTTETAALKNRIANLEKIIEELHSRNETRDIEQLLQKNTIEHQAKFLDIIARNAATKEEIKQNGTLNNHAILLDIRTNFIEQLLQNEEAFKNLLKVKLSNESAMRQMESHLREKEKMIDILRAVILEKDRRLAEMELFRTDCEHKGKQLDQNRLNMEERIGNLLTENLRYRALRSLTQA